MDQATKDLLYKGVGMALMLKDKFANEFDEIIKEGELSKEKMKESFDEVKEGVEKSKKEQEDKLQQKVKDIIEELGLATKKDIDELKELIKNQKTS